MPVKAVYCREDELRLAIVTMRAEADLRLTRAAQILDDDLKQKAYESAHRLFDAARSLEQDLSGSRETPTLDEERETILTMIRETAKEEGGYTRYGTLAEQLADLIQGLRQGKDRAIGMVATIVDEQRVKLQAMLWILKSALDSPTHKSKDARLHLALESIEQITNEMQGLDPDSISAYQTWGWEKGSWNTRRLTADVMRKQNIIGELEVRLAEAELELKARAPVQEGQ
jgi:hypothetical protein